MVIMITYNYSYLPCIPVVRGISVIKLLELEDLQDQELEVVGLEQA